MIFTVSKKPRGRPRKHEPQPTEFSVWLCEFMDERGLTPAIVAPALGVSSKAVYGWRKGITPTNQKAVAGMMRQIFEHIRVVKDDPTLERGQSAGRAEVSGSNRRPSDTSLPDSSKKNPKKSAGG